MNSSTLLPDYFSPFEKAGKREKKKRRKEEKMKMLQARKKE